MTTAYLHDEKGRSPYLLMSYPDRHRHWLFPSPPPIRGRGFERYYSTILWIKLSIALLSLFFPW